MENQTPHTFTISRLLENEPIVSFHISQESTLPEVVDAMGAFLHAVGYRFPDGSRLGYEYEYEDEVSEESEKEQFDQVLDAVGDKLREQGMEYAKFKQEQSE